MLIKISQTIIRFSVCLGVLVSTSCAVKNQTDPQLNQLIAKKLMIDLRYFCNDGSAAEDCTTPMTELPPVLADMISETGVGGIILFADNLQNTEQMLRLNYSLQQAAQRGGHESLFISIDQEGGRVVRLPQNSSTAFAGNMAIGASYALHGTEFAEKTGDILAQELMAVGFNVNFAPTVDVNVNPLNPVINVRSFGEDADIVAKLGMAQMVAMQKQGMMATLKHFPGHGDTNVDSHTGLPVVNHSLAEIEAIDLKPFQYAIDHDQPAMIMTAHIQYPQLDSTEFMAKDGAKSILPATMSRKILTDLLRNKMGFKGLIVTDALNMAGIAHYFDETEAVVKTFHAGSDIALMPMAIRTPSDITRFKAMITAVAHKVQTGVLNYQEVVASAKRIDELKRQYGLTQQLSLPLEKAIANAKVILGAQAHRAVEQALADSAVVEIKNNGLIPLKTSKNILLAMPDTTKCMALTLALKNRLPASNIDCYSFANGNTASSMLQLEKADVTIVADITPDQSLVEMGGMDDIKTWRERMPKEQQKSQQLALLQAAKAANKHTVFISLRAPYNVNQFVNYSDVVLATFSYNLNKSEYVDDYGRLITQYEGAIYNSLADILTGKKVASGTLPVSIDL